MATATQDGEPLRIVHVTFDMRIGGTEQVIRNLIEGSDPGRFTHRIFCIEEPIGPWGVALQNNGVALESHQRRPAFDTSVLRALRSYLRRTKADVVHCHQYTPWTYGALAALGLKTRVVFTEHGRFYPDRSSPKRRFVNPLLERLTDQITAISEATRAALVDFEFLRGDRIQVVYNGIRGLEVDARDSTQLRSKLGIPADAPVLGTIARFDPIKNHAMMLRAFRLVLDQHPDCRLILVGDGEERGNIEALIADLGIARSIVLPGYVPKPDMWLAIMDVFLLSSFSEGTSMTLLEAMSLGKPCVVTSVGGNPEIVLDRQSGTVTPSDQAQPFADAISELLNNHGLLSRLGQGASDRFSDRFTYEHLVESYAGVYARTCATQAH
ncbi:MAG: glycosyltransferase [Pseudomonadota bacterium]